MYNFGKSFITKYKRKTYAAYWYGGGNGRNFVLNERQKRPMRQKIFYFFFFFYFFGACNPKTNQRTSEQINKQINRISWHNQTHEYMRVCEWMRKRKSECGRANGYDQICCCCLFVCLRHREYFNMCYVFTVKIFCLIATKLPLKPHTPA